MEAISLDAPARVRVAVAPEALARVAEQYERGRYLDAWRLAEAEGPLRAWRGADALVLAGRLAGQLGAQRLGQRLLLKAAREHPGSPEAWAWAMRAVRARRGPYAAREVMRRRDGGADGVEALALRAELATDLHDFDEAERYLARAEALAPEDPWLQVVRAAMLKEADSYDAALAAAERALAAHAWFRPGVDARAELLVLLGRDEEALAFLEEATARLQAPSTEIERLQLELELGRVERAEATLARLEALTPLRERGLAGWLEARRSDVAYQRGDLPGAAAHARRSGLPFFERLAARLEAGAEQGRVLLAVPWVRQHRLTCAPATFAALARHFGVEAEHLEIAEAICYDGTPDHAQRSWAAGRGLVARELTVTWPAAVALLDRGVPFALSTVHPGNAHMQAVVGYDRARGTLLLRDPTYRSLGELTGDGGLAEYAHCGPKGLVLLPPAKARRLEGLELPEAALHDAYHGVQAALVAHDRAGAVAASAALATAAPGHRLALHAARSIASYDRDEEGRLRATEALLALFPDDVDLRLSRLASLADLGRSDARVEWLRGECARAGHPLLELALADLLRPDARAHREALRLARRAAARLRTSAHAYHVLADVLWDVEERDEAVVAYRTAACLEPTDEHYAESYFLAARLVRRAPEALAFLSDRFERLGRKAPGSAITLFEALDLLDRGREALEVLDRALAWRPRDGALLLFAARARAAAGDEAAAGELVARAAGAARPQDVKRASARLAEARGELAEAAALWAAVAEVEPFDLQAVEAAARLLGATGAAAGKDFLRALVRRHPHHHGLGRLLAQTLADAAPGEREAAIRQLLEASPSDAWAWRELALVLVASGRQEEALGALDRAAELDPHSPTFHRVRASVLDQAGRPDEAKAALLAGLRASVDDEWALRHLLSLSDGAEERERHLRFIHGEMVRQVLAGDALLAYQRAAGGVLERERIVTELRAAWEARPDLWHAWVALARQLEAAGRPGEAVALLERAAARFELTPRVWLELAEAHRTAGARAEQRAALERALSLAPAWPDAAIALAEALKAEGEHAREREVLAHAVRRSPEHPFLRGWHAEALWTLGEREAAVAELEVALRLEPGYGWAWTTLLGWCAELGRHDAPRALAERIGAARPHDADAWVLLARARQSTDEKLEALDRGLALAPRHVAARELRAEILAAAGRQEEALAALAAPAAGRTPRELRLRAARLQAARGEPSLARLALEELLEAEPDFAEAWMQLADQHEEAGRHEDAVAASRRLARLAPNDAVPRAYLGRALLGAGERDEAKAELRRAIQLDPAYAWPLLRLFDAHLEDGEVDAASALLAQVERHVPAELALCRARAAAARRDADAAFDALAALLRAEERTQLDVAAGALDGAGWGAGLDERLDAALHDDRASRAAGGLLVARRLARPGGDRAVRRRLGAVLDAPRPTAAALGAAEAYLSRLAAPAHARRLRRFASRHRAALDADAQAWGTTGFALSSAKLHGEAARWLAGWKGRAGVAPWMLLNLGVSLRDLGRLAEAAEASAAAVALAPDHTTPMHEVLAAVDAALAGDAAAAARLGPAHHALPGYYRFLAEALRALAASSAPGDPRERFSAALVHLRRAAVLVPQLGPEPFLRRVRREALRRIARARGGDGARAFLLVLLARLRLWLAPAPPP